MAISEQHVEAPAPPAGDTRRFQLRFSARTLLLYSLLVAVLSGAFLAASAPDKWPIQGSREAELTSALRALERGAPPLTGDIRFVPPGLARTVPTKDGWYAIGAGDDLGMLAYAPLTARLIGSHDPLEGMKWLYAFLFAITVGLAPVVYRALFRSDLVAVVAPFAVLLFIRAIVGFEDIYWILAWAVLTLVPPLMLLARRWPRRGLAILVGVMLAASFATSIRSQAGLPILLGAAVVLLLQPWRWRRRIVVGAVAVAAYVAIMPFGFAALREYRNDWVGDSKLDVGTARHPVWHSAYIGLGYYPNKYGIRYYDEYAIQAAHREDPGVRYVSSEYEDALKHVVTRLAKDDPGFVAKAEARKMLVTLGDKPGALAALAALAAALALGIFARDRGTLRRYLLVVAPALPIGVLPLVLATPTRSYAQQWTAALVLVMLLAVFYALANATPWQGVRPALARTFDRRPRWGGLTRWERTAVIAGAVVVPIVAVAVVVTPGIQDRAHAWAAAPPPHVQP